jgi:putative aldouronate transport system substrate-binding protein
MKRWLVFIVLLALVMPAFATGTDEAKKVGFHAKGYPIVDNTVTLRIFAEKGIYHRKPFNELPVPAKYEKLTNVHIDWIEVPTTAMQEKKNLMLASNDLPDAFSMAMPDFDLVTYGSAKVFIPLQDLIKKYMPNYQKVIAQKPDIPKFTTAPDGNIYSLARLNEGSWMRQLNIVSIYKPWVDKLGKSMPKTTDEFYDLMMAIKNTDLNGNGKADEIPIGMALGDLALGVPRSGPWYVYYAFGLPAQDTGTDNNVANLFVEDGRVKYAPADERFKQATAFLNKLWKAGLIEPEAYTLTYAQMEAKLRAQPVTYGLFSCWNLQDEFTPGADPRADEYVPLTFFTAPGVAKPAVYRQPYPGWNRGELVITKVNKYPEVTVRWVDTMYEPYASMEWIEGMIGSRLVKDDKGVVTMKNPPAGVTTQEYRFAETQPGVPLAATMELYRTLFPAPIYEMKGATIDKYYAPYWPKEFWSNPLMAPDDMKQLNAMDADIRNYVTKTQAKWITQGGIETEWNDYLKQLETLGLSKVLKIRQAGFDRLNKK